MRRHLDVLLDRPLTEVMFAAEGSADADLLNQTAFTQPALFAIEVALFRLLEHWGVTPDVLIGHSIGEIAAAHVAGVFSLEDACALVAARGRLMQSMPEGGAMVAIQAPEEEIAASLAGREAEVSIAAINGPTAVVIAGDEAAVLEIAGQWERAGRKTRRLRVSHAFHSPRMDGVLGDFRKVVEGLSFAPPTLSLVSNVTGTAADTDEVCSPEYWVRHVREAVRFADGVRTLEKLGVTSFVEVGPDGVLTAMAQDCLTAEESDGGLAFSLVSALRQDWPEIQSLTMALAELHVHGTTVKWDAVFAGRGARRRGAAHLRLPATALLARDGAGRRRGCDLGGAGLARPPAPRRRRRPGRHRHLPVHRPSVRCPHSRGWPTTYSRRPCSSRVRPSWKWPCARRSRWATERLDELTIETPLILPAPARPRSSSPWASRTSPEAVRSTCTPGPRTPSRTTPGHATPPACSPGTRPPRQRSPWPRTSPYGRPRRRSRSTWTVSTTASSTWASPTVRPSRGCEPPGAVVTRSSPRSTCPRHRRPRPRGTACTRRCSTPRCTPSPSTPPAPTAAPFRSRGTG
ncbi:hypothetical protein SANTM175S_05009 [Streptomyces antimycoticus]